MFKLKPRYYGVWVGLFLGFLISLSGLAHIIEAGKLESELRELVKAELLAGSSPEKVKSYAYDFAYQKIQKNSLLWTEFGEQRLPSGLSPGFLMLVSGLVVIAGSLIYLARKKQRLGGSKWWILLEILLIPFILQHVILSFFEDRAYFHPIYFLLIPAFVTIAYISLFFMKPSRSNP